MQIIANPTGAVHLRLCVRSSACDLLHGGCSALLVFLRCSRQVRRAGPVLPLVPPPPCCCPSLASLAVLMAGCPVRVSFVLACSYASPSGLCVLRARSGRHFGVSHMSVKCWCARAAAILTCLPLPLPFCARHSRGPLAGRR